MFWIEFWIESFLGQIQWKNEFSKRIEQGYEYVDGEYDKEYVEDEYEYDEEDDQENLWIFGLKDLLLLACIFILRVHNLQK